jgi:hypothetical protein
MGKTLPLKLRGTLGEEIVPAVDMSDAVLEDHLPLVLHSLNLIN